MFARSFMTALMLKFLVLLHRHLACWKTSFLCLETFMSQFVDFFIFFGGGGLGGWGLTFWYASVILSIFFNQAYS